jgi:hypothetical protein
MDPIVTQVLCGLGILLALSIGTWPILSGILKRRKGAPPEDHLEERNKAAAMLIATYPYSRRVKFIYNILDKMAKLEEELSLATKNLKAPDNRNA